MRFDSCVEIKKTVQVITWDVVTCLVLQTKTKSPLILHRIPN